MKAKWMALVSLGAMLTPFSMFAATKGQEVTFPDEVTVNGTTIPAGTYRVEWEGTGAVTAKIEKGRKVVATVPATVTTKNTGYDGAVDTKGKALLGILFKNADLEFQQDTSSGSGQ